jgi:hypothetical protein
MKKIVFALLSVIVFLGCSSKSASDVEVESKLVVGNSLESLQLNDQQGVATPLTKETKKVIFAFSKDVGHDCNDFFATKDASYLAKHNAMFVADVSAAPSLIRSMFIMPGLKEFEHTILVIDDKEISSQYKLVEQAEKIVLISLENLMITKIEYLNTPQDLEANLEAK